MSNVKLGLAVHYYSAVDNTDIVRDLAQPLFGFVAGKQNDEYVNLAVFNSNGAAFSVGNVPFITNDDSPLGHFCTPVDKAVTPVAAVAPKAFTPVVPVAATNG